MIRYIFLAIFFSCILGYHNLTYMPYMIVCTFIVAIVCIHNLHARLSQSVHVMRFSKYILYLCIEIIKSSLNVSKIIWSPRMAINPSVKWIDAYNTVLPNAIYANSITLTPGTITVATSMDKLLIHALNKISIKELEQREMEEKIRSVIC